MSEVSLERFYFALFDDGLTFKTLKLAFIGFLIQTLQLLPWQTATLSIILTLILILIFYFIPNQTPNHYHHS